MSSKDDYVQHIFFIIYVLSYVIRFFFSFLQFHLNKALNFFCARFLFFCFLSIWLRKIAHYDSFIMHDAKRSSAVSFKNPKTENVFNFCLSPSRFPPSQLHKIQNEWIFNRVTSRTKEIPISKECRIQMLSLEISSTLLTRFIKFSSSSHSWKFSLTHQRLLKMNQDKKGAGEELFEKLTNEFVDAMSKPVMSDNERLAHDSTSKKAQLFNFQPVSVIKRYFLWHCVGLRVGEEITDLHKFLS